MRTVVADAAEMPGMVVCGLGGAEPDIDRDPRRTQLCVPLPGHQWIGILDRGHDAGNTGGNDGVGTGRRSAEMRTWLQRHIERGAACDLACAPQRLGLSMGTPAGLRPTAPDNQAILDDDRADGG